MERPEYIVARSCRNCYYFKKNSLGSGHDTGVCKLPTTEADDAECWKAHATGFCAAHTWRGQGRLVQKLAVRYGMTVPEDTL